MKRLPHYCCCSFPDRIAKSIAIVGSGGFLFEGQLTMGPEPPRHAWSAIRDTLRENATRLFNSNDPNVEQDVTRRLQNILNNARDGNGLPGQNPEFVGLEEAIAATLAVSFSAKTPPSSEIF